MTFDGYLKSLQSGEKLSRTESGDFLGHILDDASVSDVQITATLTLLSKRPSTTAEVCGFIDAMKLRMTHVSAPNGAIDTCGTGGDKLGTFNISTAAAILIAAGGVPVAKHGNRAATSLCGSYDVLTALHVPAELGPTEAAAAITQDNFVFLFAPIYHPSLKRLAILRKQLGFPTIFNLLGPLLNPADVRRQVIGTTSLSNARILSEVMASMNHEHTIVLSSEDGLDEASLASPVHIFDISGRNITETRIKASDFSLDPAPVSDLRGGDAQENAVAIIDLFRPTTSLSPRQRVVVLNAGLGFYVAGISSSIAGGVVQATAILQTGQAESKLRDLQATRQLVA